MLNFHHYHIIYQDEATCGGGGEEGVESRGEPGQGETRKALHQRLSDQIFGNEVDESPGIVIVSPNL